MTKTATMPVQGPETPQEAAKTPRRDNDLVYEFRISRKALPLEFRNLWELAFKGPEDKAFHIEIDADMLSTVISRISFIFEQDGL